MANGHHGVLRAPLSAVSPVAPAADSADFDTAYDAFYRAQYDGLVRFLARRLHSATDAEDVAQESLVRFLRHGRHDPPTLWKPLLYKIAINLTHDRLRTARLRHADQHIALDGLELDTDAPGPEDTAIHLQAGAALRDAVLALPPKCQQVFLLARVRGMTAVQVAQRCGISVRSVEKHLARALKHITHRVGEAGWGASRE